MVQSALDIKVWKEIAISKQLLIKTATDALGIDPECSEDELRSALEQGVQKISEADAQVAKIEAESGSKISAIEEELKTTQQELAAAKESIAELEAAKTHLQGLLDSERKVQAKELQKVNSDLESKVKQLKNINTLLADSPENVARKMKVLNKKKFDESNARKRAEDEARGLKKDKQDLQKQIKEHEANLEKAETLVDQYRELRNFSEEQYTQLKGLEVSEEDLKSLPEQDKVLLETLEKKDSDESNSKAKSKKK